MFKTKRHGTPSTAEYILLLVLAAIIVVVILILVGPLFLGQLGLLVGG